MNTFLPYSNFIKSAQCLDNKRLGKQRTEVWQIYNILKGQRFICLKNKNHKTQWTYLEEEYSNGKGYVASCMECTSLVKQVAWYNHPAVQMWKGYEQALLVYGADCCDEWTHNRHFKDTLLDKFVALITTQTRLKGAKMPSWFGNESFHSAMRSNLLRKDPIFYGKYGWKEPNNLPYIWGNK